MKHSIILLSILTLMFCPSMIAQNKTEQVKHIRKLYAEAKKQIADNGKGANPRRDVLLQRRDTNQVSEDFIIEEDYNLHIYFTKQRTSQDSFHHQPYFMISNSGANGHSCYREMLFDTQGHLLFSFMKVETHAGFVVESRYYYDAKGNLVEQKHKVGGSKESSVANHSWSSFDTDMEQAQKNMKVFQMLMSSYPNGKIQSASQSLSTKAERMKFIRSNYTKAKQQVDILDKSDYSTGLFVTIHNQDDVETPPITDEFKFYYDKVMRNDEFDYHCYFISERRNCMYYQDYCEFLVHPQHDELLFFYSNAKEEGEQYETRYYYDATGRCIESKSNSDVNNSTNSLGKAQQLFKVFHSMFELLSF